MKGGSVGGGGGGSGSAGATTAAAAAAAAAPSYESMLRTQWRRDVVKFFQKMLAAHLVPLHQLPMHEAVQYYARSSHPTGPALFKARKDRTLLLRRAFTPSHKIGIIAALGTPRQYLACDCCDSSKSSSNNNADAGHDGALPTMHDACIAYKIYATCGRMINLFDWCEAFCAVCEGSSAHEGEGRDGGGAAAAASTAGKGKGKSKGKGKGKGKAVAAPAKKRKGGAGGRATELEDYRTRFVRGVAELQHLGFLRPTGRKADHVTKLVFPLSAAMH